MQCWRIQRSMESIRLRPMRPRSHACVCVRCHHFVCTGQWSGFGQTECSNCDVGTFNDQTKQSICFDCLAGSFGPSQGLFACPRCPAGSSQPSSGQTTCVVCQAKTYQNQPGSLSCLACPAG